MPPFTNFTTKAREAIKKAHELIIERGQNHVAPLHLLTALVLQEESLVFSILDKLEVDVVVLTDMLLEHLETPEGQSVLSPAYQIYLTPDFAQVLERSTKIASSLGDELVSTEHLFIAILETPGKASEILQRFQVTRDRAMQVLTELRSARTAEPHQPRQFRAIARFTRNLTQMALQNKLDPVIGRDNEISRIIQILSRRTKNNPILIGEAGVG